MAKAETEADIAGGPIPEAFELGLLSDIGTTRTNNEDSCGHTIEAPDHVLFAVADGVGGYEGGEVASKMAIDITLQAYRESPKEWGASKRLHRAVQRANIEIYNFASTVPELRRMATTLTAVAVENGILNAAHIGDCRLYLLRGGKITQISKDHTVVGERVRLGLMSEERARTHPDRSALMRSLGRELIVSIDRITLPLRKGDEVILCSDGLYNILDSTELTMLTREFGAVEGCEKLIRNANQRGTHDNLTVAIFKQLTETADPAPGGLLSRLKNLFSR
ncbi:MAG TPA: protein phosphatase 2C domain-containing protein [Candidatus Binataceae bacterium]|nr:protein phosphatase 2C domain-containing protein [Candidatus Binataceae bacterium]